VAETPLGKTSDWNPDIYLTFASERAQPVIDLVHRIGPAPRRTILDVGCGPGNSTEVLAAFWPRAKIVGIDHSPSMIRAARERLPSLDWRTIDVQKFRPPTGFDLVFSNAVIHWIPRHESLLPQLLAMTNPGGVLAIQVPLSSEMPIAELIDEAYRETTNGPNLSLAGILNYHPMEYYYDLLSGLGVKFDLWTTGYVHVMDSPQAIYEMMKATRIRPYLDALPRESSRQQFEALLVSKVQARYQPQGDGKILFPFKRLFLLVRR